MVPHFRHLARFGISGETDRQLSFDVSYAAPLQARSEGGCRSPSSGPTRAPDAANEVFGDLRQIAVHDVLDPIIGRSGRSAALTSILVSNYAALVKRPPLNNRRCLFAYCPIVKQAANQSRHPRSQDA